MDNLTPSGKTTNECATTATIITSDSEDYAQPAIEVALTDLPSPSDDKAHKWAVKTFVHLQTKDEYNWKMVLEREDSQFLAMIKMTDNQTITGKETVFLSKLAMMTKRMLMDLVRPPAKKKRTKGPKKTGKVLPISSVQTL